MIISRHTLFVVCTLLLLLLRTGVVRTRLQECFHLCTYIGMDARQLRATLLSHDEERGVLALLLGADHHLLDGASYERVDTFVTKKTSHQR